MSDVAVKELPVAEVKAFPQATPVTLADLLDPETRKIIYARIPAFKDGKVFVIQSLTSQDMMEWSEINDKDVERKRVAGMRLIVKSVVDGDPAVDQGAKGVPIMDETHVPVLLGMRHSITEGVVRGVVKHNGMTVKQSDDSKNG